MTRYLVEGRLEDPVLENAADALKKNAIREIDDESVEKSIGWTSFETPFTPNFEGSSFSLGNYLIFSLRIDKKSVPNKMVNKMVTQAEARRAADTGRDLLSKQEKKTLKEQVIHSLFSKIPATPNVYDLVWNYEASELWFFTNLKAANEALESLFRQSFRLTLIRLFPYTAATLKANLKDPEKDILNQLKPTPFFTDPR
jgi:DNA recombination-dependent growth factor C